MGRVLVITSGKGGVGKSTVCANLGSALAQTGKRVVLIDADIGLRNLDLILGLENRVVFDVVDVLEQKCRSFKQALIRDKRFESLFLLPASQSRNKDAVKPAQMKELCQSLQAEFDFVLIDCPAGIEGGFKNAVVGANEAIIVTNPEVAAVRDADRVVGLLEAMEKNFQPRLIINRVKPELVKKGMMLSVRDVQEILGIELLGIIPDDQSILASTNKGTPVIMDRFSRAGGAFRQIASRIQAPEGEVKLPRENGGLKGLLRSFLSRLLQSLEGGK